VENISGSNISYPFASKILATADKHMTIKINSEKHGFVVDQELIFPRHLLLSVRGVQQNVAEPDTPLLRHEIHLAPGETCLINHTVCEIMRVNDQTYYVQSKILIGLDVSLCNLISRRITLDSEVYLSHPQREDFKQRPAHGHRQSWEFAGKAILPGQMFAVQWKEVQSANLPTT
jgi:hypothetical protein